MLYAPGSDIVLLPGTLFEILRYSQDRLKAAKKISNTALGSAFIDSFNELDFNKIEDIQQELLNAFQKATFSEHDLYLHSIIKERAHVVEAPLPPIDRNLFYQCIVHLSQGPRINKILNNRIDAYNYALLAALNDKPEPTHRYVLVSNSSYMRQLDNHAWYRVAATSYNQGRSITASPNLWKLQYRRAVISPRRAALFQLLTAAGRGIAARSSQLAWELQAALHSAQQEIALRSTEADNHPDVPLAELRKIRSDNVFLFLISSFFDIESQVADAQRRKQESTKIYEKNYFLKDPVAFFEDL